MTTKKSPIDRVCDSEEKKGNAEVKKIQAVAEIADKLGTPGYTLPKDIVTKLSAVKHIVEADIASAGQAQDARSQRAQTVNQALAAALNSGDIDGLKNVKHDIRGLAGDHERLNATLNGACRSTAAEARGRH